MNFHAVKWKFLVFIRKDGISKWLNVTHCNFLLNFEQRLSYFAQACVERYTVLENDSYTMTCYRNDKVSALYLMKIH